MATELLPVVDLRSLSQSDLDALAAASTHALAPQSCPDADPLPPLKIDRAALNESAGSRKQTFSRLRLGAAASSSSSSPPARPTSAQRHDPDGNLVAYHLRALFFPDDPSPPPPPEPQTLALALALAEPSPSPSPSPAPNPDLETTNAKGISVDLLRLAGMVEPYDAELRRRTAGMASEAELQGYIASLAGRWVSQRQRRRFVDASFFGDHLPRGWKLQLGLKRKARSIWVHCFSYMSPKGNQFSTCKEVSAYLMSLLGYPEVKSVTNHYENTGQLYLCANDGGDNVLGCQDQIGPSVDKPNALSAASLTFASYSNDSKDENERNADNANAYECQKCNLTFCDRTAYVQHHLSYHEMRAKRRRTGNKFGEPVIGKDGMFECPVCHKTFAEESRYFGHVGAHARYGGWTPEAFLDKASSGRATNDSLAEISFSLQELTGSPGQNKVSGGEAGFQHHSRSNEHGDNNSTVTELFSTNYSNNSIRPNKAWSRPEEIPPIPSVCRYTNYKGHTDAAMLERASNSNDQSVSNLNGFAGVSIFNNQPGSSHVVGPTAFGTTNHYQNQIIDRGMTAPKHVNSNTVKARDVNLNSCLDTISFPIASANNETSAALNEANQSSFSAKCFSGSFNNNDGVSSCSGPTDKISSSLGTANKTSAVASRCLDTSHGPYSENNIAVYQSNLGMRLVYPVATKADCFGSGSVQRRNSDKELISNTKEHNQRNDNVQSRTSKEAGLRSEAYNSGVFSGGITDKGFAQFNNSFTHTKQNASSRCSLPESNTPTTGNFIKGSGSDNNCMNRSLVNRGDASFTMGSFINRPINNNEQNVPMLEVMGKSNNEMQNHYNVHTPGCEPRAASSASRSANGRVSMAANFGSVSTAAESIYNVPMTSTSQDQCDLQLGFGAQKQQIVSSHADLRTATAGSPQLGSVARKNPLPTGSAQFGSMDRPKSFPTETPQFGGFARPNIVPVASSQFGSTARPDYVCSTESSQFTSMVQANSVPPAESSQFGSKAQPSSVPPAKTTQFRSTGGPNSVPPAQSSQFGGMIRSSAVPPESSQFIGSTVRSNSVTPAESSQFGSMARPNSVPTAVASQFGNPSQYFVSATEPTLVLGYAPQMGGGPPPPVQLGWDLSLPRMVTGGSMVTCVCIWCNSQFHHFGPVDGQQAGSFGFICPACKDRMSGHHNMPNNGSWQP
ncbi:hypothetical protein U9M48_038481 [Paspalum notatum var. saurae]|uniref:Methyl-CpG-binding domain-containing protein 8 n=1 Tax=Paspalum notatum var. saurae TaxID=547442 RepID=A0AAQ3XDL0_PASNO